MTKRMDTIRIANAFQQAAVSGHYEQCRNIVSVMLMDPAGFTTEEYKRIKTAIRKAGNIND